ncbi:MAG: cytochrome P450 [Anaerolineales bacterium]
MNANAVLSNPKSERTLPPGPKGLPVVGVASQVLKDPLGFFFGAFQQYGDVAYFSIGAKKFYSLGHPDHVQYVLQENNHNYHKASTYEKLRPLLGNGLLTSEGAYWLRQRRLIQPAFHRKRLAVMASVMTDCATNMLDRWQSAADKSQPLNVADEFMRVTLDVVSRTMFSTSAAGSADEIGRNLPIILEHTNEGFWEAFDLAWLPTPRNRQYQKALSKLDAIIYGIIEQRRQNKENFDDLLTMLLESVDAETGEQMTDEHLRDEVMTIYLAGHETTANALSWGWYLLAQHPEVTARLRAEVDAVLQGRIPTVEDTPNLKYTRMVIDEVLRLYPSVWTIARAPLEADEIGGYHIPPGAVVALSPYITHRHPAFWDEPEKFDPERFSPERAAKRHPFAYFPFGGGPRLCIGNNFALMEATLMLAMIAQRYELSLAADQVIEPQPVVTLRPRYGIQMLVRQR